MSQPAPPPPIAISPPLLQSSLLTLCPLSQILQSLHHRNKNQHSSSKWWSAFDILRRNVAKLIAEMEECLEHSPLPPKDPTAANPASYKTSRKRALKAAKWEEGVDRVQKRARFMRGCVAVKGWEGFGGLVGDRQFAQVGLGLVGVLGGVNKVLGLLLGEEELEEGEGMEVEQEEKMEVEGVVQEVDMGVVVKREEEVVQSVERDVVRGGEKRYDLGTGMGGDELDDIFGGLDSKKSFKKGAVEQRVAPSDGVNSGDSEKPAGPQRRNRRGFEDDLCGLPADDSDDEPQPQKPGSKTKKQGDEFDDIFGVLGEEKPKKKKQKKVPGDKFDDIFGGLSEDKPKKKKKKVGGGDEFDDIFGELGGEKPKKKKTAAAMVGVEKKKKKKKGNEFDDIFAGL